MAEAPTHTGPRRTRRDSMDEPPLGLRLVLVGKTGSGRGSSGNTILGGKVFDAAFSGSSVTRWCCKESREVFDRRLTIVDTPGLFDTSLPDDSVKREISKCINMSAPGPHAILLVIKVGAFTAEEQAAVMKVEEVFGPNAWRYTIVLFTHGDQVQGDFGQMLERCAPALQSVLQKVDNRFHIFNNNKANERGQVLDLLEKVEQMVSANGGEFYSNPTYLEVVEKLNQREEELKKSYQEKLEEEVKAVELKYEEKLQEAQEERQQVEERMQLELKELRRYYQVLERGVRHVVENTVDTDSFNQVLKQFHEKLRLN